MNNLILVSIAILWLGYSSGQGDSGFVYPGLIQDYGRIKYTWQKNDVVPISESSQCTTPDGNPGECKPVNKCQPLLELVNDPYKTSDQHDYLRKSMCSYAGLKVRVCCSKPIPVSKTVCTNPEGKPGVCVDINQCHHLAAMLAAPMSQQNIDYIQQSRCKGSTLHSVCCDRRPKKLVANNAQTAHQCQSIMAEGPPNPSTGCCGIDTKLGNKIGGGTRTGIDEYPWLALLEYIKQNKVYVKCGGGLISGRYVLTAAHCVIGQILQKYGKPQNVHLGEYDTANKGPDCITLDSGEKACTQGMVTIPIERTIPHPGYINGVGQHDDIAVIRLKTLAPYTDFIRPICLPRLNMALSPPTDFTMMVAGWGKDTKDTKTHIKQHVALPYVEPEECQTVYLRYKRKLWGKQICAGGEEGKDTCAGDSGSPLMYQNGSSFEAIGLVSFGPTKCGQHGVPGVYTNVFAYKDWILENIVP